MRSPSQRSRVRSPWKPTEREVFDKVAKVRGLGQVRVLRSRGLGVSDIFASEEGDLETLVERSGAVGSEEGPRHSSGDAAKKKVRFSLTRMDGDTNFKVTMSIKKEADGVPVFYKVSEEGKKEGTDVFVVVV